MTTTRDPLIKKEDAYFCGCVCLCVCVCVCVGGGDIVRLDYDNNVKSIH